MGLEGGGGQGICMMIEDDTEAAETEGEEEEEDMLYTKDYRPGEMDTTQPPRPEVAMWENLKASVASSS